MKKILILGSSGYLGNALMHNLEYNVLGIDNYSRRDNVKKIGSDSLIPVKIHPNTIYGDICNFNYLKDIISQYAPDTIIHLAEQPSAPYSMKDAECAAFTQFNNIIGTLNLLWAVKEVNSDIHIIKLGTAGQYPDWLYKDIKVPEKTRIKIKYKKKDWEIPTPKYAGSFYHFSKLYDSYNIDYACKIWGLNITELNQGIVYGHIEGTRFDYDEYFGTVVNRFITQAIVGIPLTVYGTGEQMRGFISINNVIDAIKLIIEDYPKGYNIIHQLTETYTIKDVAKIIQNITNCKIMKIENPRVELSKNKIIFEAKKLKDLGLKSVLMKDELPKIINIVKKYKDSINKYVIQPTTKWK